MLVITLYEPTNRPTVVEEIKKLLEQYGGGHIRFDQHIYVGVSPEQRELDLIEANLTKMREGRNEARKRK